MLEWIMNARHGKCVNRRPILSVRMHHFARSAAAEKRVTERMSEQTKWTSQQNKPRGKKQICTIHFHLSALSFLHGWLLRATSVFMHLHSFEWTQSSHSRDSRNRTRLFSIGVQVRTNGVRQANHNNNSVLCRNVSDSRKHAATARYKSEPANERKRSNKQNRNA